MTATAPHTAAELRIDEALVTSLLKTLMPHAAAIALQQRCEGKDYVVWRFGNDWAIRLPRRQLAVDRQLTELAWLPRIAQEWPFRAPVPVRVGAPSAAFPWPWTIVPWIDAAPVSQSPLSARGAVELGWALRAIHQAAPPQAPLHPLRSHSLAARAPRTEDRLHNLKRRTDVGPWRLDLDAALRLYRRAASLPRPAAVWSHLDLRAPHVLAHQGSLVGIIDWGDAGAGDPATDLGQALVLLPPMQWDGLVQGYGSLDVATFERARGEAVEFAAGLALSADQVESHTGWAALIALGVAQRAS